MLDVTGSFPSSYNKNSRKLSSALLSTNTLLGGTLNSTGPECQGKGGCLLIATHFSTCHTQITRSKQTQIAGSNADTRLTAFVKRCHSLWSCNKQNLDKLRSGAEWVGYKNMFHLVMTFSWCTPGQTLGEDFQNHHPKQFPWNYFSTYMSNFIFEGIKYSVPPIGPKK